MAAGFVSHASIHRVFLYGKYRDANAFSKTVMLKTLKCHVRVVWVFRRTQWIALYSTDMDLSVEQIIEYYSARWKIESGFKEIKQDIGSSKSQTRTAHAVINHINFSMMVASITWIYGTRLESITEHRHKVKGPNCFAFPDLRHIIAKAALSNDFNAVCNKQQKLPRKSFVEVFVADGRVIKLSTKMAKLQIEVFRGLKFEHNADIGPKGNFSRCPEDYALCSFLSLALSTLSSASFGIFSDTKKPCSFVVIWLSEKSAVFAVIALLSASGCLSEAELFHL